MVIAGNSARDPAIAASFRGSPAIIIAFVVELARGHSGSPYAWLGAIGGLAYLAAIVVFRLRG